MRLREKRKTNGFGKLKTLAKIAFEYPKTSPKTRGVLDLIGSPYQSILLKGMTVDDMWLWGAKLGILRILRILRNVKNACRYTACLAEN
jgi:hypothetical protein